MEYRVDRAAYLVLTLKESEYHQVQGPISSYVVIILQLDNITPISNKSS